MAIAWLDKDDKANKEPQHHSSYTIVWLLDCPIYRNQSLDYLASGLFVLGVWYHTISPYHDILWYRRLQRMVNAAVVYTHTCKCMHTRLSLWLSLRRMVSYIMLIVTGRILPDHSIDLAAILPPTIRISRPKTCCRFWCLVCISFVSTSVKFLKRWLLIPKSRLTGRWPWAVEDALKKYGKWRICTPTMIISSILTNSSIQGTLFALRLMNWFLWLHRP